MTETPLSQLMEKNRPAGLALCARLEEEIRKLGLPPSASRPQPAFDQASFERARDPYSGEEGLSGTWLDARGQRIGSIRLHGDGSFYAEFDIAEPHPSDRRWFVEGVAAWGRDSLIKSEPKLLPALG